MKSLPLSPSAAPEILEKDIEKDLVKQTAKTGGRAEKYSSPGRRAKPDRILFYPRGRVAFVECKRPGQVPTEAQKRELQRLRNDGFFADWVDSYEAVDEVMYQIHRMRVGKTYTLRELP